MERLWGEVAPVPESNLNPLSGGEEVLGFRVAYTPGHASHHVSYLHPPTGRAFVGDTAAVRIPPSDFVMPPTPPPDIDPELWEESIDRILDWQPASLGLTHFGEVDHPETHLELVRERLREQAQLARELSLGGVRAALPGACRRARGSRDAAQPCCRRCRPSSSGPASIATGSGPPRSDPPGRCLRGRGTAVAANCGCPEALRSRFYGGVHAALIFRASVGSLRRR